MTVVNRNEPARRKQLRFAARHPVRTLRRSQGKSIDRTGFGLVQLAGVLTFTVAVLIWLFLQMRDLSP